MDVFGGAVGLLKTTRWVEAGAARGAVGVFAKQMSLGAGVELATVFFKRVPRVVQAGSLP